MLYEYIKEQTPKNLYGSSKTNGIALQFVKDQTQEICMEAVKQYGFALQFVKEQTTEICMEAVKTKWSCFTICQIIKLRKSVWKQ